MSFKDLNLHPKLLKAIEELGYINATPIQEQAIPQILQGLDLCASAQTGTGKTAAFILPTLHRLVANPSTKAQGPRVLILVPTRELALQVAAEATKFSTHLPQMRTVCIYGGAPYPLQNKQLSRPYEILVATPGRLIDHLERGRINFSRLEVLILDEADRMLDMGFIKPVEQIAAALPPSRQTLMFSATLRGNVMKLTKTLMNKPVEISVASDTAKHENIEQHLVYVKNIMDKHHALDHLLSDVTINQAIIFTATKRHAKQLLDSLLDQGYQAAALHGDMNQQQRTRTIGRLREGKVRILVATDVAARGIDVQTISHVINFDLPIVTEDYVHRIGRTGRASSKGIALSFAAPKDASLVRQIEKFTGQKMALHAIPGLDVEPPRFQPDSNSTSKPNKFRSRPSRKFGARPRR